MIVCTLIDLWLEERDIDSMYPNRSLARGEGP
jgi:hypothetical protein